MTYLYTDQRAVDDGVIVDLTSFDVRVVLNDRPITRMSSSLFDALSEYLSGGTEKEQACAMQALLGFVIDGSWDMAEGTGEPSGEMLVTPDHHALGHVHVWLQKNDAGGWTAMLPSDY